MSWPDLNAGDLEARIRTCLNEATPDFYTQAEVWRWLSLGTDDVAQRSLCIKRVLTGYTTTPLSRNIAISAYKVEYVEYLPATGRYRMLEKIDPPKLGHYPDRESGEPQYWYENGSAIGIEPMPDDDYTLRIYVADLPYVDGSEKNFDSVSAQTELATEWQGLLVLFAVSMALAKNRKTVQGNLISQIYNKELSYLKYNIVDIIPDGLEDVTEEEKWLKR